MTPTWASINESVRARLGDTEISGGQVFTDAALAPFNKQAWQDVFRALNRWSIPYVNAETFVALPANSSYIDAAANGISGASSVFEMWVKQPQVISLVPLEPALSTDPTTGFVRIQPLDITGFTTGSWVEVILDLRTNGIINDVWSITVDSPYLILNGCLAPIKPSSDYTGAAPGYVSMGGDWQPVMGPKQDFDPTSRPVYTGMPTEFYVRKGALRTSPVFDQPLVLSVGYRLTGDWTLTSPDSPVMLEDSESLLVSAVAGLAAKSKGQPGWQDILSEAYGPSLEPNGESGSLGGMVDQYIKQMQFDPQRKRRFRAKNYGQRIGGNYYPLVNFA